MKKHKLFGAVIAGLCAGAVNGLFGAGGGMVLIPLMGFLMPQDDGDIFSSSIAVILPICIVSLIATAIPAALPWQASIPYLLGSAAGGYAAGHLGHRIPEKWLHRLLGILIIWGGIRNLC